MRTLAGTLALFAGLLIGGTAMANEHRQWRMSEFTFTAAQEYPNGFVDPQFDAVFTGSQPWNPNVLREENDDHSTNA